MLGTGVAGGVGGWGYVGIWRYLSGLELYAILRKMRIEQKGGGLDYVADSLRLMRKLADGLAMEY